MTTPAQPSSARSIIAGIGRRICDTTGLPVCLDAQRFIKLNAVAAVVFLLVGGIGALLLALTRWQAVHLLPVDWFYRILTLHGINMLIFWILFFEIAILYFCCTSLLNTRLFSTKLAWTAFLMMLGGAVLVDVVIFAGKADVMMTSYLPLLAHPGFYLGIILVAVGALIGVINYFLTLHKAKKEKNYTGSVPLVVFGATAAAIIAVVTLLHGAITIVPTFLHSMGWIGQPDPLWYRMTWWGLGHMSQQVNVCAMVSVWYFLGSMTVGARPVNQAVCRGAFLLYIVFINLASAHHLLVDPGFSPAWKIWNTSYAMYLAVLASMIHGFTVPAGIETGQRLRGFTNGTFEWLRKAPWSDPGFSGMWLSLVIFGFLGGITGVTLGTEQINILAHNTLRVTGHFHATVVGGTTLAFMAVTYYVLPLIFRRRVAFWGMAKLQPYVFGGGITAMAIGMIFMGILGIPRRHWDSSFAGAPFPVEIHPASELVQVLFGAGGIMAAIGALMFIAIAVVTVFFGKPVTPEAIAAGASGIPSGVLKLPAQTHSGPAADKLHAEGVRGTIVLVTIFFLCFILYYFTNWMMLSFNWKVG